MLIPHLPLPQSRRFGELPKPPAIQDRCGIEVSHGCTRPQDHRDQRAGIQEPTAGSRLPIFKPDAGTGDVLLAQPSPALFEKALKACACPLLSKLLELASLLICHFPLVQADELVPSAKSLG